MPSTKKWSDMTEADVQRLKRQQCIRCHYFSRTAVDKRSGSATGICDYLTIEGHSRGCSPLECTEKGIYRPRKGKGRRKAMRLYA